MILLDMCLVVFCKQFNSTKNLRDYSLRFFFDFLLSEHLLVSDGEDLMKSLFCWAKVRLVGQNITIYAMLTRPALTWVDKDEDFAIASFNTENYPSDSPIHNVFPNDVFEIAIKTVTGHPLSTEPGLNFPFKAIFVVLKNNNPNHFGGISNCNVSQLLSSEVFPANDGWINVISSSIAAIKYLNLSLGVRFNSGAEYVYAGVSESLFEQFTNAPSKGEFLNMEIKLFYHATMITSPN